MRLLTEHLRSVDETYYQHLRHALRFSGTLAVAGFVCLVHAIFPFLFQKTGSALITRLHQDMVTERHNLTQSPKPNVSHGSETGVC